MFTANLAGTSSHLRPDHHLHRSHSRLNLDPDSDHEHGFGHGHHHQATPQQHFHSPFIQGGHATDGTDSLSDVHDKSSSAERDGSASVASGHAHGPGNYSNYYIPPPREGSGERCDLKAWIYLSCFAVIIIGGIVLIVMAAMGHFNKYSR